MNYRLICKQAAKPVRWWKLLRIKTYVMLTTIAVVAQGWPADNKRSLLAENRSSDLGSVVDAVDATRSCGPRSLFVYLRLLGYSLTYDDVESIVPISDRGTSLAEMLEASHRWNSSFRILKAGPGDLARISLPVIAHMYLEAAQENQGHYVVVLGISSDEVLLADASNSVIDKWSRDDFERVWSGYLLSSSWSAVNWINHAFVISLATICLFILGALHYRYSSRAIPSLCSGLILLTVFGCRPTDFGTRSSDPIELAGSGVRLAVPRAKATSALQSSKNGQDLGVISIGQDAKASFTLINTGSRTLNLKLGVPSCGCLDAQLLSNTLDPGQSTTLSLTLSGGDGYAGSRNASITVGSTESDEVLAFGAKAMIEGMLTYPYTLKYPPDLHDFSPRPIEGEVIVGNGKKGSIDIVEVKLFDSAGVNPLQIGSAQIAAPDRLAEYTRYRFFIPVRLQSGTQLLPKSYPIRITYTIDGITAEHMVQCYTFSAAE